MATPVVSGVTTAAHIAKIFAAEGVTPRIVVDPSKPPAYDKKNAIVYLPALPTHDLTEEEQAQLRAYFWHEAQGEQSLNTYGDLPEIANSKQRKRLANGIGDAFIDQTILKERPGAGLDIRKTVDADKNAMLAEGDKIQPSVGVASAMLRYLCEGLATWEEMRAALPNVGELIDYLEKEVPNGTIPQSADEVVDLVRKADKALEAYKGGDDEEQEGPDGLPQQADGGEGDGEGEGNGPPSQRQGQPKPASSKAKQQSKAPSGQQAGGGQGQGQGDQNGSEAAPSQGASYGNLDESQASAPRQLSDGEDSGDRIAGKLGAMLAGKSQGVGHVARQYDEYWRTVVTGDMLDKYARKRGWKDSYQPAGAVQHDAAILANRLRMALVGPTMMQMRNQEYGRFDSRRGAMALAGSRTVYTRRRELPGESVAVSIAWDESGSMGSHMASVVAIVERFALALQQMPNVVAEFTGWTDGHGATEEDGAGKARDWNHFANHAAQNGTMLGNSATVHRVYKSFEESPTLLGPRLRFMAARSGTPMTEGFGYSARRLASRPERRKVYFFITDGCASYIDTDSSQPWGYAALPYEVERASASGVDVIVFNIGEDFRGEAAKWRDATHQNYDYIKRSSNNVAEQRRRAEEYAVRAEGQAKEVEAQFGPTASVIHIDGSTAFMQPLFNTLTDVLTHKARAIA